MESTGCTSYFIPIFNEQKCIHGSVCTQCYIYMYPTGTSFKVKRRMGKSVDDMRNSNQIAIKKLNTIFNAFKQMRHQ